MNSIESPSPVEPPGWHGLDIAWILLGSAAFFLAGLAAIRLAFGQSFLLDSGEPSILLNTLLASLEGIALIGAVYLFGLRRRGWNWEAAGLRPTLPRWWIASIAVGVVVIPLSSLVALAIQLGLGRTPENSQIDFIAPHGFTLFGAISMFILGGIVAPFAEELVFRGVLFSWLRSRWGFWPAGLVSSLLFGALHGEVSIAGAAAVLGLILAWVYERSKSLWPAVIIHAINNSAKILLLYILLALGVDLTGV